jgi:hypothetical protein
VRRFEPGETIALRDVLRGRVFAARPATIVRDDETGWMLFLPVGNRWYGPDAEKDSWVRLKAPGTSWALRPRTWTDAHVLSFAFPDAGHAVLHFWDEDWKPLCWYVNVEAPLRRFPLGLDTFDHDLDVVVEPDRSAWRWKDEDDVALGIEVGAYTTDDAGAFRREGERGLRRVLDREPPFDREWSDWRPDPRWPVPELPAGWDRVDPS